MRLKIFIAATLMMTAAPAFCGTVTISANTNWSMAAIAPGDTVNIQSGARLNVDVGNAQCAALNIGTVSNGIIAFVSGSKLTVSGAVTVGATGGIVGTIDMSLGGTLTAATLAEGAGAGTNTFIPGSGTVVMTGNSTLPASNAFASFNVLTIANTVAGNSISLGRAISLPTLNLGAIAGNHGILNLNGNALTTNSVSILGGGGNTITNTGAAADLTINVPAGSLSFNGALTGANLALVKDGPGTLIISSINNTYGGGTRINGGTLQLGTSNCLPATTALTLGNGTASGTLDLNGYSQSVGSIQTSGTNPGNVVTNSSGSSQFTIAGTGNTYSGAIVGSVTVVINVSGTMIFSGMNSYTGTTMVQGGTLRIGAADSLPQPTIVILGNGAASGTFDLNGFNQSIAGISTNGTGTTNTITNTGAAATLTVGSFTAVPSNFGGQIQSANLTLAVNAGHTLTLTGTSNTFGALSVINNATLKVGAANTLPANVPVTLGSASNTAGTLDINGFDVSIGTLASSGTNMANAIRDGTAPSPQMSKTLTTNFTGTSTFNGQCTAVLAKSGTGTLILTQSNGFSIINVLAGTVTCGAANIFGAGTTSLTTNTGGTFDLNGNNQMISVIGASGTGVITSAVAATLTLQNTQPNSPFSYGGAITGVVSLDVNTGPNSTFTLSGSNTYTGATNIDNGAVLVSGTAASSAFAVNGASGGPLSGTGTIGAISATGSGTVNPGDASVGTLNGASADFSSNGTLKIRIPSDAGADRLSVTGALTLGGTSRLELDLGGYAPSPTMPPSTFTVASGGSRTGTFQTVQVLNNTSGYAVEVSYGTATVTVTVGAVPVITNISLLTANAGGNYNETIQATNNPSNYDATGLPAGLNVNPSNGQISGTPMVAGDYTVTLKASNQGGSAVDVTLTLTVNPGAFAKLQLLLPGETAAPGTPNGKSGIGGPDPQIAGVSFNVIVNAVDNQWNIVNTVTDTVTFTSTDPTATLPADGALVAGTQTFAVTLKAVSPRPFPQLPTTLVASDVTDNTKQNSTSEFITVNPGAFTKLQLLMPGENADPGTATGKSGVPMQQQAGQSFSVKVNAVDDFFNLVNTVTDTIALSSSDPLAQLPPNAALVNGTKSLNVTLNLGPTQTVTVNDTSDGTKTGDTSPSVTVFPGEPVRLQVLLPGESNAPGTVGGKTGTPIGQISGTPFAVTVNLVDASFTIVPSNDGILLNAGTGAILPGVTPLVNGTVTVNVTLVTGPTDSLQASDVDDLTVFNGLSSTVSIATITSSLTAISPDAGVLNGADFTLTVTGTNFLASSVVRWNGSDRTTTFVSDTQLTAAIPSSDLAVEGQISITVYTPPPGTGSTSASTFFVYSGTTAGSWVVTNTSDSGPGSLRLALASCRAGDTITFDSSVFDLTNSDAATLINVVSELPEMDDGSVTIDAQDRRVTINGSSAGAACGITVTSSNNTVMGLSIVGFTQSGICVMGGAQNNKIGGNRTLGTGPNGQGLRIGNCGAFGVEIDGAGTTGNIVRACWLGLDASGIAAQPNLAGVLIKGGASQNTIGGTGEGEGNVISGNTFEGVTVTGTGTDDNVVVGNIIGSAAIETALGSRSAGVASREDLISGRTAVGNGTAGVFLSKGTNGSRVGGDNSGEGNGIANNGGNGVEVRAQNSRKNSARSNGISKNRRGGIALFDGSNDGIVPPTFVSVTANAPAASAAGSRSDLNAVIIGRAPVSTGTVEIFADPEDQGSRLVGSATVVNGDWQVQGSVADTENITATFTDDNGNTSAFAFFGKASASSGDSLTDSDGDGVSNTLELLAGTNPSDPADAPTQQGAVDSLKFSAGLNFTITGKDSIKASLQLTLPTGLAVAGATVAVQIDDVSRSVTLDTKGKSPAGTTTMKITTKKGATTSVLALSIRNQDLRAGLTPSGLIDKTTSTTGESHTVPLAVVISSATAKYAYVGSATVTYKAVLGKRGKAK